ncbi:MAG: hypothetical protein COW00_04185 [Bdellovibrio sp. CG12_big_fil_rev_8_21_14_0_65_39_13]|nr:MAG: hypothetical protein COW78_20315 [Bdellovibrio sp. CG22_combo_CG10-13_8_21_14_all_39_27]PIQ61311.1 MAG: hypothetical protein COW00_04185 [Bdellovibrio sp. CG12_big_fil_rev_8_21_14_0_65_39_13]PIR33621.1 MAG: hypothetical protein COV37_15830 [Bdellovibrio sp. CG11_big_fil_rev_8_21_14_0_20_39_38]PJB53754.1 MAG: hypothetical protein CO099_05465 [Bdellovibrio sp. CG_4_9_14_3_um_filter_39_7]
MFRVFILIIFSPVLAWASSQTVACSHPQVCNLINDIAPELKATLPEAMNGDPHLYSPSPSSIKKYLNVDILIAAPLEMNPWIERIVSMRTKQNKKSYILKHKNWSKLKVSKESMAHFWLSIDSLCDSRSQISTFLDSKDSACPYLNFQKELTLELGNWKNSLFILSHDALTTLLKIHELEALPIESGGHDREINSRTMKNLAKLTQTSRTIIWIEEPPMHFPSQVLKSKKPNDIFLRINIVGEIGHSPTQVLSDFLTALKEAKR